MKGSTVTRLLDTGVGPLASPSPAGLGNRTSRPESPVAQAIPGLERCVPDTAWHNPLLPCVYFPIMLLICPQKIIYTP